MVLHAGQHAQLALHGDTQRMGVLHHFPRQLHVVLKGQAAAVEHHRGVAPCYGRFHALHIFAVIQMQRHGDRAVFPVPLYRRANIGCALNLVLHRAVHKIRPAAHKSVGQVGPLQNSRATELLVYRDGGLRLGHCVYVERALRVIELVGGLQNCPHRYQHIILPLCSAVTFL